MKQLLEELIFVWYLVVTTLLAALYFLILYLPLRLLRAITGESPERRWRRYD